MKHPRVEFTLYHKILFAVLGILLITWFSKYIMDFLKPVKKEGLLGIPGTQKDSSDKMIDDIKEFPKTIENVFKKIIQPFVDFIDGVNHLFREGIPNHLACGKSMSDSGFNGGIQVLNIQFLCFWDKFVKFFNGDCTLYYWIDMWTKLLTIIFIRLPITIIKAITGVDLHFLVDLFKGVVLVPLNELCIVIFGFGFLEWSDTIKKRCYKCFGQIKDNGGNVIYEDWKSFDQWALLYKCSNDLLLKGINKIFFSAFPSDHWKTWYKGNHLDGADDAL
jgi:hypothetical protein